MGMPTTPAYIIMTSLLVPAIIKLGVPTPAAHMFALLLRGAVGDHAAGRARGFRGGEPGQVRPVDDGRAAVSIGVAGFIVPFMFVYEPALLMIGSWEQIAYAWIPASIGIVCLAAGLHGYMLRALGWPERVCTIVAGLLLVKPGIVTDMIGYAMVVAIVGWQWKGRQAATA